MRQLFWGFLGLLAFASEAMGQSERDQIRESELRTSSASPNFHSPAQAHQWRFNHFDWQLGVREMSEILPTDEIGLKSSTNLRTRFARVGFLTRYPSRAAGRLGLVADFEKGEGSWSVVDRNAQVVDAAIGAQNRNEVSLRPMLAYTFGKRFTVGVVYEIARRQEDDGFVHHISDVNILTGAAALHGESWEMGVTYGDQIRGSDQLRDDGKSVTLFNGIDAEVMWGERQAHAAWHVTQEWTWSFLWQKRGISNDATDLEHFADKKSLSLEFQGDVAVMSFVGAIGTNYIGPRFSSDFTEGASKSFGGGLRWVSEFGSEFGFQYVQRLVEPAIESREVVRHTSREISLTGNLKM